MGLEKELWLFQQNETQGRNRVTKSCYTLQAQIQFILLLPLAWDGAERAELPKEWQGHVHSDGGKCPSWASPSSTLLTSCCCWTVGSWMLQIKITSLASQNNPSSPQGSDPSRCRDSELWLMRLGAHSHHGPRAAQMALDALGSVSPHRLSLQDGAVRFSPRQGIPSCCSLPPCSATRHCCLHPHSWVGSVQFGLGLELGHSQHRPESGLAQAALPPLEAVGQTLPSCWNQ